MQEYSEKFQLEQPRDFGAILADAAIIIFRNWQTLLTTLLYVTFPFLALSFIIYFAYFAEVSQQAVQDIIEDLIGSMIALGVLFILAAISTQMVSLAYVYTVRRLGMVRFTPGELWLTLRFKWKKLLGVYSIVWLLPLIILGLCILSFFIAKVLGGILLLVFVFGYIWFFNGAMYAGYIAMDTELSAVDCVKQAIELVNLQWWEAFGYVILLTIVINAVHGVIFMPFTVMELIKNFSAISAGNAENIQKTTLSLLSMFQVTVMVLFGCFSAICYNLKYYDLRENKYGHNTLQRIQKIGSHLSPDED